MNTEKSCATGAVGLSSIYRKMQSLHTPSSLTKKIYKRKKEPFLSNRLVAAILESCIKYGREEGGEWHVFY